MVGLRVRMSESSSDDFNNRGDVILPIVGEGCVIA